MEVNLTPEQVLGFAPTSAVNRTCRTLAVSDKWLNLGTDGVAAWGEFALTGKKPFQVQIALSPIAINCKCFSRVFPCNHGLALLMMFVEQRDKFATASAPEWVTISAEKPRPSTKNPTRTVDKKRHANILAGLLDLERWMHDLVRNGLATVRHKPAAYWEQAAIRLVDAQASELADEVRELAKIPESGKGWTERLLKRLGRLQLLIEAYKRFEDLPPATQNDLRAAVGWLPKRHEIGASDAQNLLYDSWLVVGKTIEMKRRRRVQRTWLWGRQSNRAALVVNIAHGRQLIDTHIVVGTEVQGDVAFYDSQSPLLGQLIDAQQTIQPTEFVAGYSSVDEALAAFRAAQARNPWLQRLPLVLNGVRVHAEGTPWLLTDSQGFALPLKNESQHQWHLLALSSAHHGALCVFGEWDGVAFVPISVWTEAGLLELKVVRGVK